MTTDEMIEKMEESQRAATEAMALYELNLERRDELAFQLWNDGWSYPQIAERLDAADRSAGGSGVTLSLISKRLYLIRREREDALLEAATS